MKSLKGMFTNPTLALVQVSLLSPTPGGGRCPGLSPCPGGARCPCFSENFFSPSAQVLLPVEEVPDLLVLQNRLLSQPHPQHNLDFANHPPQ